MAEQGNPVGKLYVSLDMDASKYKKAQAEIFADAGKSTDTINKIYNNVGTRSDAMYDAMRKKAQTSLDAITQSTTSSAAERIRAEQGAADKIKQINEQQFGHHTTLLEGLKKNWIAASVAIGAAMVTINKAWGMVKIGAEYAEQEGILNNLSKKYKTSADEIVSSMARESEGLVANSDLMQIALGGIGKEMSPDQMIKLAGAAEILGDVVGQNTTTALKELSEALESGRVKALKGYAGTTIDLTAAFGELASKMTTVEKANAMYSLIMIHATKLQGEQTEKVDNSADKIEKLEAKYKNLTVSMGIAFKTAIVGVDDFISRYGHGSMSPLLIGANFLQSLVFDKKGTTGNGSVTIPINQNNTNTGNPLKQYEDQIAALKKLLQARVNVDSANKKSSSDAERAAKDAQRAIETATKSAVEATRKDQYEMDSVGQRQYEKDIARIKSEAEEYHKKGVSDVIVAKFVATEKELAYRKSIEEEAKLARAAESEAVSAMEAEISRGVALTEAHIKAGEEYEKIMEKVNIKSLDPYEEAKNKILEIEKEKYTRLAALASGHADLEAKLANSKLELEKDTAIQIQKLNEETFKKNISDIAGGFGQLESAFSAMAGDYEKGSEGEKKWASAAHDMEIAQRAIAVVNAVQAVAAASALPAGAGFAAGAAMWASMISLLATIGETIGGGSSASVSVAALPASTVLGAEAGTGSQSIENSYKLLQDIADIENVKLTRIYEELKSLNFNITAVITNLATTGGLSTAADMGINLETQKGTWGNIWAPLGGLLGGDTINTITGEGISIGAAIVQSILNGASISAQQYTDVTSTTSGPLWGLFGGGSTNTSTQSTALDNSVTSMLTLVFKNIGSTLVDLAGQLGTDTQSALNYSFGAIDINLQNMTADEMNTAMQEAISTASDTAVSALFGSLLSQYQQLNEGLLETAVRLVSDKEIILGALEMTGQSFSGTAMEAIALSENLISLAGDLSTLTDAISTYYDKFNSEATKQADLQSNLTSTMAHSGMTFVSTRESFKNLVESLDLTRLMGQEKYVTLMQLADSADQYYSYLEEVASKKSDLEIQIMELTGDAAGALAAQREIELSALDRSLIPLQKRLYALQDEATATAAAAEIDTARRSLEIQIMTLTGDTAGALAAQREDELAALDASLRPLQERIYLLTDEAAAIDDLTTAVTALQTRAQTIAQFITDMSISELSPVQSAAAWDMEYAKQRTLAMASGATDQQISDYLAFAKQYLSYEQSYGTTGSYQAIYDAIMNDVNGLGSATNAALDVAQKQLDVLIQIRDGNVVQASYASGTDYVPETGLYKLHQGEIVTTKSNSVKELGAAIGEYIINSNGGSNGETAIHNHIYIDGKEIQYCVTKGMRSNPDMIKSVRKAVN